MLRYITSIILFLTVTSVCAQSYYANRFTPSKVRVGYEVGSLVYYFLIPERNFTEFTAEIDVDKFNLITEYGLTSFNQSGDYHDYKSDGTYFRVGFDYNFLAAQEKDYELFMGLRYAFGSFDEVINYKSYNKIMQETGWPEADLTTENTGISSSWFEITAGLKARVIQNFYMGYTIKYKVRPRVNGQESFAPYYVPGYGKRVDNNSWALNYYVLYNIPFRKKSTIEKPTKTREEKLKTRRKKVRK